MEISRGLQQGYAICSWSYAPFEEQFLACYYDREPTHGVLSDLAAKSAHYEFRIFRPIKSYEKNGPTKICLRMGLAQAEPENTSTLCELVSHTSWHHCCSSSSPSAHTCGRMRHLSQLVDQGRKAWAWFRDGTAWYVDGSQKWVTVVISSLRGWLAAQWQGIILPTCRIWGSALRYEGIWKEK